MKLASLKDGSAIIVKGENYFRLSSAGFSKTLPEIIKDENALAKIKELKFGDDNNKLDYRELDAPLKNPTKIIAVGLNYIDHAKETKMEIPKIPLIFAKFPNSIIGPFDTIKIPKAITTKVDYEVELGVIIGKKCKNISKKDALKYIFGYTIINDVSARDLQFSDKQWVRAKSLNTFCPLGPFIVTSDEINDPQNLKISCEVNGEKLQDSSTKKMFFTVSDIVSLLSEWFTLEAGDIIATGTPGGVGFTRKPPVYLKAGDVVKTTIEGIGEMINNVEEI